MVDRRALCVRQAAVPHRGAYGRIDAIRQGLAIHHHYGYLRGRRKDGADWPNHLTTTRSHGKASVAPADKAPKRLRLVGDNYPGC